jgi:hypothetical protein
VEVEVGSVLVMIGSGLRDGGREESTAKDGGGRRVKTEVVPVPGLEECNASFVTGGRDYETRLAAGR